MIEKLVNQMRREAERVNGNSATTRLGIISGYNPDDHTVRVMLQPDGTETGWMPLGSPWVGNGWGMFAAPAGGEQVEIEFQEGGHEVPLAVARIFDDRNRPLSVPGGEFWLVHQSGSCIKLTNDGKILFSSATEIDAGSAGSAFLTLATSAIMAVLNGHTHISGAEGSPTGPMQQQLTTAYFTTVLKGN